MRRRPRSAPKNWVHPYKTLARAPFSGRGDGTPYGTSRPGADLDRRDAAEQHNALLLPHKVKKFYGRPRRLYISIRRPRAYPASSRRRLVPSVAARFLYARQAGVSGGLVQDRCGLVNLKTAFTLTPSTLVFSLVPK